MAASCGGRKATIIGSNGNDRIVTGKGGVQVIDGRGGDDLIISKRNKDIVCGGAGDDRIYSGTGRDKVFGEARQRLHRRGPRLGQGTGWGRSRRDDRRRRRRALPRRLGRRPAVRRDPGRQALRQLGQRPAGRRPGHRQAGRLGRRRLGARRHQPGQVLGGAGVDTVSFATATAPGPRPTQDGVTVDLQAGYALGDDSQRGNGLRLRERRSGRSTRTPAWARAPASSAATAAGTAAPGSSCVCLRRRPGRPGRLRRGPATRSDPGVMVIGGDGRRQPHGRGQRQRDSRVTGTAVAAGPGLHRVGPAGVACSHRRSAIRLRPAARGGGQRQPQRRRGPRGHDRRQGRRGPGRRHPDRRAGRGHPVPRRDRRRPPLRRVGRRRARRPPRRRGHSSSAAPATTTSRPTMPARAIPTWAAVAAPTSPGSPRRATAPA